MLPDITKICRAASLARKNPMLFLQYLFKRRKRLIPGWYKKRHGTSTIQIGGIRFQIDFDLIGRDRIARQIYFQCCDLSIIHAMKKYLTLGDIFIDIGANVGYLSAVGANLIGSTGQVISFEPGPHAFQSLKNLPTLNPQYQIHVHNQALSDQAGTLCLEEDTTLLGLSSVVPGVFKQNNHLSLERHQVEAIRLDQYIADHRIGKVACIKIDVEGHEFSVLKGLENYFLETPWRPVIICEIAPSFLAVQDIKINEIVDYLAGFGYMPHDIYDCRTCLSNQDLLKGLQDVIFIPESICTPIVSLP